jgi:AhpD family alkylhydroperoxidase
MPHVAASAKVPAVDREDSEMHKHWPELAGLSPALKELRGGAPELMKGFAAIARAALEGTALEAKTKELIALAIAVAIRCDACIAFHADSAVKRGASRAEVMETMGMAIYMRAGPSVMYAAQAIEAFDQFAANKQPAGQ